MSNVSPQGVYVMGHTLTHLYDDCSISVDWAHPPTQLTPVTPALCMGLYPLLMTSCIYCIVYNNSYL